MKLKLLYIFLLTTSVALGQNQANWTEHDTTINDDGSITLKISNFVDSAFFSSFRTTIVDTTIEIKRAGFLWSKKYKIETHVFGDIWDYQFGEKAKNSRVCGNPHGITFITRIE